MQGFPRPFSDNQQCLLNDLNSQAVSRFPLSAPNKDVTDPLHISNADGENLERFVTSNDLAIFEAPLDYTILKKGGGASFARRLDGRSFEVNVNAGSLIAAGRTIGDVRIVFLERAAMVDFKPEGCGIGRAEEADDFQVLLLQRQRGSLLFQNDAKREKLGHDQHHVEG